MAALILLGLGSCNKNEMDLRDTGQEFTPAAEETRFVKQDEVNAWQQYQSILAAHEARVAAEGLNELKNCVATARVPQDFATIQEAVDAVCDNGDVIVSPGEYTEVVTIYKPGIHVKANGNVTLNGRFIVTSAATEAQIQKFNVLPGAGNVGFYCVSVDEIKIMQNTITGPCNSGIQLWNVNNAKVFHNSLNDMEWGIFIASFNNGVSNHNMIQGNTVTGVTYASCIGFQGDTDYNVVQNNTVKNNNSIYNAGIMFYNYMAEGFTGDNNVVRNNVVENNTIIGIWITSGGMNNTIGPNNSVRNNTSWGIYLASGSEGNHVFNNTVKGNGCDIGNAGTNNTFKNNKTDCTSGV